MKNVIFNPWIGGKYKVAPKKILVLGESHYGDISIEEKPEFTSGIINLFLSYKAGKCQHARWMNTFTRFTNVIHDARLECNSVVSFWQSIMFYNYIQKAMEGPRVSPTELDFEKSLKALVEVVSEYRPNTIVVWGQRLWDRLPNELIKFDNKSKSYFMEIDGDRIDVLWIYHPSSSSFSYDYWKELDYNLKLD